MAKLQQTIIEKFLATLGTSKALDAATLAELRNLFAKSKKPKADDLVKIFAASAAGDIT
ncbi:hypothetical protein K2Z84_34365 [Candidatus Binatia bacterium]|nr:hypothetical protein [Microbacteriaceae bacterium]MBY0280447.1 hypothetical protein [Candidatus Binatia bacterium]